MLDTFRCCCKNERQVTLATLEIFLFDWSAACTLIFLVQIWYLSHDTLFCQRSSRSPKISVCQVGSCKCAVIWWSSFCQSKQHCVGMVHSFSLQMWCSVSLFLWLEMVRIAPPGVKNWYTLYAVTESLLSVSASFPSLYYYFLQSVWTNMIPEE